MSMKAFRWAKQQAGLSSSEKFVLIMIADHYNDSWHRAWPSQATLSNETGLSVPTVKRSIRGLRTAGIVDVEPWAMSGAAVALQNRYLLPMFDRRSIRASRIPVRAFHWAEGSLELSFDETRQIPGSSLLIAETALD
ncbi:MULTISPECIES: helix-turn-helix domain-containing protein [unclassified Leifsonia]|uniref:helix-turn-helix domain-containing protein n=1 Tax=unclassified Leifsonia TaxID=2663824 RepID=UPI0006F45D2A|nr:MULTISPECIES: helix-turn-helix domain-containing protein [unclassified Leifsonia]KQX07337.1 hypothetical protein ASC59_06040 [Leifsonia sp. Root1293]KRA11619.1 hypothetical protein ASD61_06040 [Leifsonia sp. Root60]